LDNRETIFSQIIHVGQIISGWRFSLDYNLWRTVRWDVPSNISPTFYRRIF